MKSLRLHKKVVRSFKAAKGISQVIAVLLMIAIAVIAALVAYFWITGYFKSTSTKVSNAIQIQNVAYTGTHLIAYVQNVGKGTVHFTSNQCLYVDGALRTGASVNPNTLQVSTTASVIDNITLSIGQRIKLKLVTTEGTFVEYYFTINTFTGDYALALNIVGNGNVALNPPGQVYFYDTVSLTASPSLHWSFSGWSGDVSGTSKTVSIYMNASKHVTATFMPITQQITFDQSGVGTDFTGTLVTIDGTGYTVTDLPQTFTWNEASDHPFSFASPLTVDAGKQYIWASTTGLSTAQTGTVTVPAASGSVTATFGTQYYLTVSSPYGTPGGAGWYNASTTAYATLNTDTVDQGNQTQRVFTNWSGDASGTGYAQSDPITMSGAKTAVANWKTQYEVAFNVDPSGKGTTNPSGTGWYDEGPPGVSINATATDISYKFSYWNATGNITFADSASDSTIATVNGPDTITANFAINTVDITITSSPNGPYFVTVDSLNVTTPYTISWTIGTTHTLEALSPVSGATGAQYVFTGWSDLGSQTHTYTVPNAPDTVTANYKTQYSVTFDTTGLDPTASGTVVTINGTTRTYGELPNIVWVDSGDTVTYSYENIVSSSATGTQFSLITVTGSASPITVTSPVTVTGTYETQYAVTFAQTGLDSTAGGVAVTVNGSPLSTGDLSVPYSIWFNSGDSVTYLYTTTVPSSTSGEQFRLSSVTGPTSPITVSGPVTVTGNYVTQYSVTFAQSGLDSTATGGVVTVNGSSITYGSLPYTIWVDSGASVTYSYTATVASSTSGKRFALTSVTGPSSPITVSSAITVTGNYNTQFSVTFAVKPTSPVPGTTSPSGTQWYDSGANVPLTATVTNSNYAFSNWTVTGSISIANAFSNTTTATIGGTGTITANFGLRAYFVILSPPTDITIGNSESVIGLLVGPSGNPQITLTYTRPDGSKIIRAPTIQVGGFFIDDYAPDTAGNWQLVISFAGSGQYAPVATTPYSFSVNKISVSLSCGVSPTTVGIGQSITVSGSLTPALNGQTITLTFTRPDLSTFTGTAVTGPSGSYTYSYTPNALGAWSVVASWPGDATHTSATSSPQPFTVANAVSITITSSQTGSGFVSVDGAPITTPHTFTWFVGSTHTLFATLTVPSGTGVRYVFTDWSDGGAETHTYTVLNLNATVAANYKTQYYLTVNSPTGTNPTGQGWYDANTQAASSVTSPVTVTGPPRIDYTATGYTGTGDAPASGSGISVSFTINQPSAITWHWHGVMTLYPDGDSQSSLSNNWNNHNNWECVSDTGNLDGAHYVYRSGSSSRTDYYTVPDAGSAPPGTITINSVTINIRCQRTSGGTSVSAWTYLHLNGGSSNTGSQISLTTTWTTYSTVHSRPGGGTWSWNDIRNLEPGVQLQGNGNSQSAQCTLVWAVVDFNT